MKPYAVIESGGKQYRVEQNSIVQVERLAVDAGSQVNLDRVLAVSDGNLLQIGAPYLDGVAVQAVVMEHLRGPKVVSFKYKRRKGYRRKQGHRQELTKLKIQALSADAPWEQPPAAEEPAQTTEPAPQPVPPVEEFRPPETASETGSADPATPPDESPDADESTLSTTET